MTLSRILPKNPFAPSNIRLLNIIKNMIRGGTFGLNNNVSYDLKTIRQEKQNSISCVYDILDLNNSGKWNDDGTIELYRPGSSSQLDMIKFRSFSANIRSDISSLSTPSVIGYLCCNFEFNENSEAVDPRTSSTDYCDGQEFIRDSLSFSDMTLNIANQAGNHQYQSANAIYDNDVQHEIILSEFQIPLIDSFDDSITDLLLQARYAFSKILGVFDTNDTNNQTLTNQSGFTYYESIVTSSYVKDGGYDSTISTTYNPELTNVTYLNIPGYSFYNDPFNGTGDTKTGQMYYVRATYEGYEKNFILFYQHSTASSMCYIAVPNYFIFAMNPRFVLSSSVTSASDYLLHAGVGFVNSLDDLNTYQVSADKLFWDDSSTSALWYFMNQVTTASSPSLSILNNTYGLTFNSIYTYGIGDGMNYSHVCWHYTRSSGDGSAMSSSIDLIQKRLRLSSGSTLTDSFTGTFYTFGFGEQSTRTYTLDLSSLSGTMYELADLKAETDYVYFLGVYLIPFDLRSTSIRYFQALALFVAVRFNDDGTPRLTTVLSYRFYYSAGDSLSTITADMITQQASISFSGSTFDFVMLDYINDKAGTTTTPYRFDDFNYEMALYMWEINNIHVPNCVGCFILPSIEGSRYRLLNFDYATETEDPFDYDTVTYGVRFYDMRTVGSKTYDNCYVQMNRGRMFVQCWQSDGSEHIISCLGSFCTLGTEDETFRVTAVPTLEANGQVGLILDAWVNGNIGSRDITDIVSTLNVQLPILNFYLNEENLTAVHIASLTETQSELNTVLYAIDSLWGADGMMYDLTSYSGEGGEEVPFVMANSNVSLVLESRGEDYLWNNSYVRFYPQVPDVTDAKVGINVYVWNDTQHITAKNGAVYHALNGSDGSSFYDSIFTTDTSTGSAHISCPYLNMISSDYKYSGKLHFYVKFHTNPSVVNFDPNIIQHSRFSSEDNPYKQFINHTGNLNVETYPVSRMYYFTDEDLYNRIVVYLGIQNTDQTLKLVVSGYGSTNDIVFYLNETSMIDYKDYVVDPTMRCITCAIYDASGEILTPTIASSIYSNITICCDWSFYN